MGGLFAGRGEVGKEKGEGVASLMIIPNARGLERADACRQAPPGTGPTLIPVLCPPSCLLSRGVDPPRHGQRKLGAGSPRRRPGRSAAGGSGPLSSLTHRAPSRSLGHREGKAGEGRPSRPRGWGGVGAHVPAVKTAGREDNDGACVPSVVRYPPDHPPPCLRGQGRRLHRAEQRVPLLVSFDTHKPAPAVLVVVRFHSGVFMGSS